MRPLFSWVLFKEQLKRFWAISILFFIVLLFTVIFPIYNQSQFGIGYFTILLSMRNPFIAVMEVLVPLITAAAVFSYGFQNKAVTDMYAYPFRREQVLVTNSLAGLTLFTLPILVICLILLIPLTSPDVNTYMNLASFNSAIIFSAPVELFHHMFAAGDVVNTPLIVAELFARLFICFTFYYTLFILASTLAGNMVVFLIMCLGLPFVPIGLVGLSQLAAQYYSFGYSLTINQHWIMQFLVNFNPVLLYRNFHVYVANYPDMPFPTVPGAASSLWMVNVLPPILCYIVISAAFFAVSVYCTRKRRAERAGDSVVFKPVKNALIFLTALLGMMVAGFAGLRIFHNIWVMYISSAAGFVLFYFIAHMIAERSFDVLSKAAKLWKFGAVAVIAYGLVLLVTKTDIFGFSRYVPDQSSVEGVYVNNQDSNLTNPLSDSALADNTLCTDEATIAAAISIQKKIIDSTDYLHGEYIKMTEGEVPPGSYYVNDYTYPYKYFVYKLKNGRTIAREYYLPPDFIKASGLQAFMSRDDVILSRYPSLKSPDKIKHLGIWFNSWPDTSGLKLDSPDRLILTRPEQIEAILKEIQKDIIANEPYMQESQGGYVAIGPNGEAAAAVDTTKLSITIDTDMGYWLSKYGVSTIGDMFNLVKYDNTLVWLRGNGYYSTQ